MCILILLLTKGKLGLDVGEIITWLNIASGKYHKTTQDLKSKHYVLQYVRIVKICVRFCNVMCIHTIVCLVTSFCGQIFLYNCITIGSWFLRLLGSLFLLKLKSFFKYIIHILVFIYLARSLVISRKLWIQIVVIAKCRSE